MQIRLLGVHQGESKTTKFLSILVDGRLALDAGSITGGLTFEEQQRLDWILVTHCHFDHIKDIPMIAFNTMHTSQIQVYCQADTREALESHIMNQSIWPKMYDIPRPEAPSLRFHEIEADHAFAIEHYRILPLAMKHPVPTVGYYVAAGGHSFFFTSDTGGDCHAAWVQMRPDLLICESTLPDRLIRDADAYGHLTPAKLVRELEDFRAVHNDLPRVIIVHMDPRHEAEIRQDVAAAATRLGSPIEIGYEGMVIEL
jgi:ribonuclease BN (tRNA processing enzyme)